MSRGAVADADATHPDLWGAGLRFGAKALNVKTVARAATPADVLRVCLAHNLRSGNEDHRHRSRIDKTRAAMNEVLHGPACPDTAAELAINVLSELGIKPPRRDSIMAVELVFQPPDRADTPAFWSVCLAWSGIRYRHIVSAVVHRDQSRPHMHLIALAVADGRLAGNDLTSGPNRFVLQRRAFMAHVRDTLGLRPDRPVKTLADLVVSTGKGPKTRAAAARRDSELMRSTGAAWIRCTVGMGVDGHGGRAPETVNPHAHPKTPTPLLRSFSSLESVFVTWPSMPQFQCFKTAPAAPSPKPPTTTPNPVNRRHELALI